MKQLRLALDPNLIDRYGPEIHWVWRLLLTGIGWAWQEVPLNHPCDVAYVSEPAQAPAARLCIQADPKAWSQPADQRLCRVARHNGLAYPEFKREATSGYPIHISEGQVICERDLIFDVFWLATGQEESCWPKDKHGFFDLNGMPILGERVLPQALASHIMYWLEKTLCDLGCQAPEPRWPNGKRAAAAVGHDVDYPEVIRWLEPMRILVRQGQRGIGPAAAVLTGRRHHWQFPAWVELEKRLHTRSAFYFVPRQGSLLEYTGGTPDPFYDVSSKKFRDLFRFLSEEGFEIGLHASYLAYHSQEKFSAEKQKLEDVSGQPVVGNRHHYWHLNPEKPEETLLIHEQAGLVYDTSLFHNRYLGWRRGLSHPFLPYHQGQRRELKTLQIPTAWMDDQLFGQRDDNPGDRLTLLGDLADRAAEHGGCLLIDIHDYVLDETLFPGWAQTYEQLWAHLWHRGDFWFGTPAEIAEHWLRRYTNFIQMSDGLDEGMA